jgi:hypothetical protein
MSNNNRASPNTKFIEPLYTKLTLKNASNRVSARATNNTSRLDRGEHHFRIIHELLRAKLRESALIFYRHYRRKLLDKVLKEGKKITKMASPGKSRTLKGQPAIPKYPTRLALIKDDYLSSKSPMELFDWWSRKLDDYGMAAENWHFTWQEIECGFYNQLTHLSNSFNKYPPLEGEDGAREQELLVEYLSLVEQIIQTCQAQNPGTTPNYMLIIDAQVAYVRLTQMRHTGNPDCAVLGYFTEILEKTKDKPIILLPQSIFGNTNDFIKFYGIPVVPFLSVYKLVHSGVISDPCSQIRHDLQFHSDKHIQQDLLTLDYSTSDEAKKEFKYRSNIINVLLGMPKIYNPRYTPKSETQPQKISLAQLFFEDIHEEEFKYYKDILILQNGIELSQHWPYELKQMYELITNNPAGYINQSAVKDRDREDAEYFKDIYESYILAMGEIISNIN